MRNDAPAEMATAPLWETVLVLLNAQWGENGVALSGFF